MLKSINFVFLLFLFAQNLIKAQITSFGIEINPKIIFDQPSQFNLSGGIYTYFDLSEKLQLSTGLHLQTNHFEIFDDSLRFGSSLDTLTGMFNGEYSIIKANHRAWFIGIPIQARYKIIGKENHLYTNFGAAIWIRMRSKVNGELVFSPDEISIIDEKSQLFKKTAFSANAGLGYEFLLSQRLKGYIEPRVDFSILRDSESSTLKQYFLRSYQLGFGITFGVRFY